MTAQRAALRRVKAVLTYADRTEHSSGIIEDLRAVVALAERAMEAESHVDAFVTLNFECFTTGETAPRDGCVCPTCITVDEAQKFLAPPRAGKRAKR